MFDCVLAALLAMTIHGIVPDPKVTTEWPDLFWGMIASLWFGNLMLINLPLIGIWVKFLQIPLSLALLGYPGVLLHRRADEPAPATITSNSTSNDRSKRPPPPTDWTVSLQ
jgi:hypothetical protein